MRLFDSWVPAEDTLTVTPLQVALALNRQGSYYLVPSLLWKAGLVVVFAPIAVGKLEST